MELELTIAGPLFAARNDGDVSFVFKKSAIAGVEDFDDLMAWMNGQIRQSEAMPPLTGRLVGK